MKIKTARGGARTLYIPAAVLVSAFLASVALADPPPGASEIPRGTSESRVVKYADLDLTRRADVLQLYQRIEDTAKRVCTPLGNVVADDACLSDALERTVAKIGLPALTSIYAAKTHQPQKPVTVAKRPSDGMSDPTAPGVTP
jgi:UrcA family protein